MDKMTNCKACGKEVAKGVNKCVHCGKDQGNFFMRNKIITIILVLAIIGGISSAMGGNKSTKVSEGTSTNSRPVTSSESKNNETKTFKIGDVVQLKNYKITVNKVYNVAGNDFAKPKDGNEFIGIDCTVENISNE